MRIYLAGENGKYKILRAIIGGGIDAYIHGRSDLGQSPSDVAKYVQHNSWGGYP